jgi:aminoglycoside phosphotransferase (APT) family kinase protein
MSESGIFGFTKAQLTPIIYSLASESVDDFRIQFNLKKKNQNGIIGEYLTPTITCTTQAGASHEYMMFVRRAKNTDWSRLQAHHYSYLNKNGVPVPRLYGVLTDNEGREVLFLEFLDEVTVANDVFYKNPTTFRSFLEIMARLNSIKTTIEYAAEVGRDMAIREGYTRNWNTWLPWSIHILDQIEEYAASDLLGEKIKRFCQSNQADVKVLKCIALELMRVVPNLPSGLIHGDFHPGNMGWSKESKELVVFDFEDIMFDTRFYDIAIIIGGHGTDKKSREKQRELAEIYLSAYRKNTDISLTLEDFLKEITIVWFARKLNLWEFLPAELDGPSYEAGSKGNTRQARLDLLYNNLDVLVNRAADIETLLS